MTSRKCRENLEIRERRKEAVERRERRLEPRGRRYDRMSFCDGVRLVTSRLGQI